MLGKREYETHQASISNDLVRSGQTQGHTQVKLISSKLAVEEEQPAIMRVLFPIRKPEPTPAPIPAPPAAIETQTQIETGGDDSASAASAGSGSPAPSEYAIPDSPEAGDNGQMEYAIADGFSTELDLASLSKSCGFLEDDEDEEDNAHLVFSSMKTPRSMASHRG